MSALFQELDYRLSPLGPLSLRRRANLSGGEDIYEIILNDEYLMSSRFTAAEKALATIGLGHNATKPMDVVVGGLGLGYTAQAALENGDVRSLTVIDSLPEIIEWHRSGLLPLGAQISQDARTNLALGDFFAMAMSAEGFDAASPGRRFDVILLDIDHSPTKLLHAGNAGFYQAQGLALMTRFLVPGGVFALWSNDGVDAEFLARLQSVFAHVETEIVAFEGLTDRSEQSNTLYLARL
ncbi:MAG: spermidine synthase [Devosia sp.]